MYHVTNLAHWVNMSAIRQKVYGSLLFSDSSKITSSSPHPQHRHRSYLCHLHRYTRADSLACAQVRSAPCRQSYATHHLTWPGKLMLQQLTRPPQAATRLRIARVSTMGDRWRHHYLAATSLCQTSPNGHRHIPHSAAPNRQLIGLSPVLLMGRQSGLKNLQGSQSLTYLPTMQQICERFTLLQTTGSIASAASTSSNLSIAKASNPVGSAVRYQHGFLPTLAL